MSSWKRGKIHWWRTYDKSFVPCQWGFGSHFMYMQVTKKGVALGMCPQYFFKTANGWDVSFTLN